MTAEEFYNRGIEWLYKGNKGSRKQELIDFAEAYHKAKVEAISVQRPNIKDSLGDISLLEAHEEYQRSPLLYMHIKLLDKYIDELLKQ